MIPAITIGIPVKNEESTIITTLHAINQATRELDPKIKIETIVCLNGTTDNTKKVIQAKDNIKLCKELNLSIIKSKPGKLIAEQKIGTNRKLNGYLLFCDADIIIDKKAIKELYTRMQKNKKLRVVCAKVLPIFNKKTNNFLRIMKDYYDMRYLLPNRGCFHGRLFMLRDTKDLLKKYNIKAHLKGIPTQTIKDLYLDKGPICDDIILSAAIVHDHGQQAIERVFSSRVYFYPPDNPYDFFLGIRRYTIEIERINTLFPEYAKINTSDRFLRPTRIEKFTFFRRKKHHAELLMELENFLGNIVRGYEISKQKLALWETVKSSKPKK